MPDFFPQGSYADAGKRFLEDYLEYIALTTEQEHAEGRSLLFRAQRQSVLVWEMLRDFSADPLRDPNLCRGNWTMVAKRPRLELSIFFGSRQKLILSAQPHDDTVEYVRRHAWTLRRTSTDFQVFQHCGTMNPDAFSTNVLELSTEGISGLRGLSYWDYPVEQEHAAASVLARRMIAGLLRHKIHQLSLSFDCVLRTPFALYGPDAILELRDERGGERSGFAQRGVDDYPGMNLLLEPSIQELIGQYKLDASEFEYFLQRYLFARVPAELRRQTLAEYLMEQQAHKIKPELLDLIDDYLDPDRRRARRIDEIAADPDGLAAFVARHPRDWAQRLSRAFNADEDDTYEWIEAVQPAIAASARYEHGYVRRKLEQHAKQKRPPKRALASLSDRMIHLWEEAARPAPLSGFQRALDTTAAATGAASHAQLLEWAAVYCPPLHAHVTERVQALRALAEQRSRKPRSK